MTQALATLADVPVCRPSGHGASWLGTEVLYLQVAPRHPVNLKSNLGTVYEMLHHSRRHRMILRPLTL